MKRILVAFLFVLASIAVSAQEKGDRYVGISAGLEFQKQANELFMSNKASSAAFSAQAELGFFVANNFKLAFGLGGGVTGAPNVSTQSEFFMNPCVSYYIPLASRFYYTPEFGWGLVVSRAQTSNPWESSESLLFFGSVTYLSLLAFEFRITDSIAMGFSMGQIAYNAAAGLIEPGVFQFGLNKGSAGVRFYL